MPYVYDDNEKFVATEELGILVEMHVLFDMVMVLSEAGP